MRAGHIQVHLIEVIVFKLPVMQSSPSLRIRMVMVTLNHY